MLPPIFEHLNKICLTKEPLNEIDDADLKSYSPFMVNRYISMCEMYIPFVNEMNKNHDIEKPIHQSFYRNILPKRRQFFSYIKTKKNEVAENEKELIGRYFEVGTKDVESFIEILEPKIIKEIVKKYARQ